MKTMMMLMMAVLMAGVMVSCKSADLAALPIAPKVLVQDAVKVGTAAALGYLTGGKVGAVAAATAQEVTNIQGLQASTAVTSAKAPVAVAVTP